ncbi:hypothetical protein TRFO_36865 [Tritrichomonas foetus]|uniref:Uncharacterized protein n=1 Tax=Tritrichomonas foetus TaxID=1144522 RepID=A0A1J4JII3_9EUKA|nr:hypothetical protein TRFO_36865 [Tritrichomonas foetus]|eukprot:OHS97004.1 hypothetical protein TRFO_36865 [Tritrichomonas foetus]
MNRRKWTDHFQASVHSNMSLMSDIDFAKTCSFIVSSEIYSTNPCFVDKAEETIEETEYQKTVNTYLNSISGPNRAREREFFRIPLFEEKKSPFDIFIQIPNWQSYWCPEILQNNIESNVPWTHENPPKCNVEISNKYFFHSGDIGYNPEEF